ncbi:MAG TPA: enoyl-CoA hydratase/isomerase family protein [Acidimicrobiales bacterium]|nr:enoyl-CoA hydratase/isomerase family protein [Acidimicrobiales bacterium]
MIDLDWEPAGEHLVSARAGDVAVLRLDRPAKLNALTPAMLPAIAAGIRDLADGSAGLVLTGTGRAFSAGDDLDATADLDRTGFYAVIAGFQEMTRAVLDTEVPVVAALNGLAVGGAAELTLACDARVGSPQAGFYFPENGIGLTISNGSTYLLPRILGPQALPLVLAGGRVDAVDAGRLGLLTEIADDPMERAVEMVRAWGADGHATGWHLRLMRPDPTAVEAAMARETVAAMEVFDAGIATAGAAAFRDRRS